MNKELNNSIRLFPEAEEVFLDNVDEHRKYLLPLATIDLSEIDSSWSGPLHFVQPIEPYDGAVGEETQEFHNYYCRHNWVAYSVENGKYQLLSTFDFFQKKYIELFPDFRDWFYGVDQYLETLPEDLDKHYEKTEKNYLQAKHDYQTHKLNFKDFTEELSLGGKAHENNWSVCTDFPLETEVEGESTFIHPLTEDGDRFRYIGYIESYVFKASSCGLLLFYNHEKKIALTTFEWT